jgi:hypothetical protein
VVEEAGVPRENHRPWASNWQTLSLATASRVHRVISVSRSVSASQSESRNSEDHLENVQQIKCMLFYSDIQ